MERRGGLLPRHVSQSDSRVNPSAVTADEPGNRFNWSA